MSRHPAIWSAPAQHLSAEMPDHPVLYFAPTELQATARAFLAGFPGLLTYAVKANDAPGVLTNLVAAGLATFDVASPAEMAAVRAVLPSAVLHYHNPVRSRAEIAEAARFGCASWSVDDAGELAKIAEIVPSEDVEIAVRFKLPVKGAAYDFGAKFGADEAGAATLLKDAQARGFRLALTFHPGTQCPDPEAWAAYIRAAGRIAKAAGVKLHTLNVGGGFPSHRGGTAPDLSQIFQMIDRTTDEAFGADRPRLVAEPGRALVAEAFTLAARVKAIRAGGEIFLNDGLYGGLAEAPLLGTPGRIAVFAPDGTPRRAAPTPRVTFGPTCDSVDRLPDAVPLPGDLAEGDYILFAGMGAYSTATMTRFNGYGGLDTVTVSRLA